MSRPIRFGFLEEEALSEFPNKLTSAYVHGRMLAKERRTEFSDEPGKPNEPKTETTMRWLARQLVSIVDPRDESGIAYAMRGAFHLGFSHEMVLFRQGLGERTLLAGYLAGTKARQNLSQALLLLPASSILILHNGDWLHHRFNEQWRKDLGGAAAVARVAAAFDDAGATVLLTTAMSDTRRNIDLLVRPRNWHGEGLCVQITGTHEHDKTAFLLIEDEETVEKQDFDRQERLRMLVKGCRKYQMAAPGIWTPVDILVGSKAIPPYKIYAIDSIYEPIAELVSIFWLEG